VDNEKKDGFNGEYDVVCYARLPRGLNPHSVPSEELAASLGYIFPSYLLCHSLFVLQV